ncbi:MAG: folate-binding protein YgfZ [Proteobacteria bacterium]|nr:folate-binding protein YgfZ [Pseudomonadota bacterium]
MAAQAPDSSANPRQDYALLQFRGADAHKFLQGQLSNDVTALRAGELMLAGLHNPQGRVLALLRLAVLAPDHIVAVLPAELAEVTAALLRRYVLRAKLQIGVDLSATALVALAAQLPPLAALLEPGAHARHIAAGVPQVYAATSGEFVAQMLNLDCIGAIAFNKGCYTGQEIIARAHYRGRTKRRLQRFVSAGAATLVPGESLRLGDGRSARVVDAIVLADGRSEFLAVAPLDVPAAGAPAADAAATSDATANSDMAAASPSPTRPLAATALPLPYALPE